MVPHATSDVISFEKKGKKSIFNEILKKEEPEKADEKISKKLAQPMERSISKFTDKLNALMNVDMRKISVNLQDTKRASSVQEFGEIAGGLPENVVSANTVDEEGSGKRPLSPFTALFSEGAGGDAVLASTIKEVKAIYRDALRASGICLKTYRNAQQIESQIVTVTTKAKTNPF